MDRYEALVEALRREFPRFRVVKKHESRLHRAIDVALRVITFGKMTAYLDSYQTTIGNTVYVTRDWDEWSVDHRYIVMRHEAVHIRQFHRYTLIGMSLLYLLVPLPLGLAYFRARFEKEAYAESIRVTAELRGIAEARRMREHIIAQFTGPSYGWMWPFRASLDRWFDRILATIPGED